MAKRRTKKRSSGGTKIVRVGGGKPIVIRQSAAPVVRARRVHTSGFGSGSARALLNNERTGAMIGAGVLGYLDKQGTKLPTLPIVGRAGTAGLILWWLSKNNKDARLNHAATGCLSIAVYELVKEGKISGADVDGIATV